MGEMSAGSRLTKFVKVLTLQTQHHVRVRLVSSASIHQDISGLDWKYLVPATIKSQQGDEVTAVFHELATPKDELLMAP